ncbi:MAG: leucyl aminopeptidase family protein [Salibaculum sp.]|uniref:leucyl aminopeptidase family protein n=1 Tax=Salibaculum sp. TaxID=2855480 RepID=UPI00286FEECF|nr:leucyl aminopeptidase family protein [Salibaculum sp.]MDR9426909.1 leucyl aminopeptidase family protein [Salibaculum sp.]MDR9481461.1 leucyl aminopeptidase family protein [Salibaculum sp.]
MKFLPPDTPTIPLHAVTTEDLEAQLDVLPAARAAWLRAAGFSGQVGERHLVPDDAGGIACAFAGLGSAAQRRRKRLALAEAAQGLPGGNYHLETTLEGAALDEAALALLLSGYRFDRYRTACEDGPRFAAPAGIDSVRLEAIAAGEGLTRDLINTPANDMGPQELAAAASRLAEDHGAAIEITEGDALLAQNLPLIHTVGRASARAPRLIDLRWGDAGPRLTLVGKGVIFDTGGLNLKPGGSMALMKKDMGGAATVLGLARMIMALGLDVQLRVLIPAVENSVAGDAFRPGDILTSRKGLTVEINNTDAEGRLVLADALALADEEAPDRIVSFATLTGAARAAVGPDIAPFYTTDDAMAEALPRAGNQVADPVWQMPFHDPYEAMIEPGIADLDNAPAGGFAGSITAALFLRRFVEAAPYTHFDIYGWQPAPAPARPKGGVGQGARALLQALPGVLSA